MKTNSIAWVILLAVPVSPLMGQEGEKVSKPSPANASHILAKMDIPKSVFVIPASPRQGQNPFFPSTQPTAVAEKSGDTVKPAPTVDTSYLVLNGITSPPRRMAMINGRTFEPGEEGEIRLPSGGKVLVKCLEIREETAVVLAEGVRRELRLRFAL